MINMRPLIIRLMIVCITLIGTMLVLLLVGGYIGVRILNNTNDQVTQLEQRVSQQEESLLAVEWVMPLATFETKLDTLVKRVENLDNRIMSIEDKDSHPVSATELSDLKETFLLHRNYHPLFTDGTKLIINALYAFEAVRWSTNQKATLNDFEVLVFYLQDDQLEELLKQVKTGETDSSWIWLRLQYLLWESLRIANVNS